MIAQALEATMLICFGLSWPLNAYKNYRAETAAGTSWQFILLITLGYIVGIAAKYVSGQINWVLFVYYLNLVFLAGNWLVYFRNVKLDRQRLEAANSNSAYESEAAPTRILMATDGSKASANAANFALGALNMNQAAIKIVSSIESDTPKARKVAEQKLNRTAAIFEKAQASCSTEILRGPAPAAIVKAAKAMDADMVIMGCRGLSGLTSVALGSVSRTVAEYTDKPVLIVK